MFRKLLIRLGVPFTLGAALVGAAAPAAYAETSSCYTNSGVHACNVEQDTASGYARAETDYQIGSGWDNVTFFNYNSGFSMIGWVNRSYNGTVTTIYGPYTYASGQQDETTVWDGGGYQVRACFKFTWSTAAVHCTAWY